MHQPVALRGGNEINGMNELTVRIEHANEKLVAPWSRRPFVLELENRLEVEHESVVLHRFLNVRRAQNLPVSGIRAVGTRLVHVDPVSSQVFGRVTGNIRVRQQLLPALHLAGDRHHADADPDLVAPLLP